MSVIRNNDLYRLRCDKTYVYAEVLGIPARHSMQNRRFVLARLNDGLTDDELDDMFFDKLEYGLFKTKDRGTLRQHPDGRLYLSYD